MKNFPLKVKSFSNVSIDGRLNFTLPYNDNTQFDLEGIFQASSWWNSEKETMKYWLDKILRFVQSNRSKNINQVSFVFFHGPRLFGIETDTRDEMHFILAVNTELLQRKPGLLGKPGLTDEERLVLIEFALLHELTHFLNPKFSEKETLSCQTSWLKQLSDNRQKLLRAALDKIEAPTQGIRRLLSFVESVTIAPSTELNVELALNLLERDLAGSNGDFSEVYWDNKLQYPPFILASLSRTVDRFFPITSPSDFIGKLIWTWPVAFLECLLIILFQSVRYIFLRKNLDDSHFTLGEYLERTKRRKLNPVIKGVNFLAYTMLLLITVFNSFPDFSYKLMPSSLIVDVIQYKQLGHKNQGVKELVGRIADPENNLSNGDKLSELKEISHEQLSLQPVIVESLTDKLKSNSSIVSRRRILDVLEDFAKDSLISREAKEPIYDTFFSQVKTESNAALKNKIEDFLVNRLNEADLGTATKAKIITDLDQISIYKWQSEVEILLGSTGVSDSNYQLPNSLSEQIRVLAFKLEERNTVEAKGMAFFIMARHLAMSSSRDEEIINTLETYTENSYLSQRAITAIDNQFSPQNSNLRNDLGAEKPKLIALTRMLANAQHDSLSVLEKWISSASQSSVPLSRKELEAIVIEEAREYLGNYSRQIASYGYFLLQRLSQIRGLQSNEEILTILRADGSDSGAQLLQEFVKGFEVGNTNIIKSHQQSLEIILNHDLYASESFTTELIDTLAFDSTASANLVQLVTGRSGINPNVLLEQSEWYYSKLSGDTLSLPFVAQAKRSVLVQMLHLLLENQIEFNSKTRLQNFLEKCDDSEYLFALVQQIIAKPDQRKTLRSLLSGYLNLNYGFTIPGKEIDAIGALKQVSNIQDTEALTIFIETLGQHVIKYDPDNLKLELWEIMLTLLEQSSSLEVKLAALEKVDWFFDFPWLIQTGYQSVELDAQSTLPQRTYSLLSSFFDQDDKILQGAILTKVISRIDFNWYVSNNLKGEWVGSIDKEVEDANGNGFEQRFKSIIIDWLRSDDSFKPTTALRALSEINFDPWTYYDKDIDNRIIIAALESIPTFLTNNSNHGPVTRFLDQFIIPRPELISSPLFQNYLASLGRSTEDLTFLIELLPYWLMNPEEKVNEAGVYLTHLLLDRDYGALYEGSLVSIIAQDNSMLEKLMKIEPSPRSDFYFSQWQTAISFFTNDDQQMNMDTTIFTKVEQNQLGDIKMLGTIYKNKNDYGDLLSTVDFDQYDEGTDIGTGNFGHNRLLKHEAFRALSVAALAKSYNSWDYHKRLLNHPRFKLDKTLRFLVLNGIMTDIYVREDRWPTLINLFFKETQWSGENDANRDILMLFKRTIEYGRATELLANSQFQGRPPLLTTDLTSKWLMANVADELLDYIFMDSNDPSSLDFMKALIGSEQAVNDLLAIRIVSRNFGDFFYCSGRGASQFTGTEDDVKVEYDKYFLGLLNGLRDRHVYPLLLNFAIERTVNCYNLKQLVNARPSLFRGAASNQLRSSLLLDVQLIFGGSTSLFDEIGSLPSQLKTRIQILNKMDLFQVPNRSNVVLQSDFRERALLTRIEEDNTLFFYLLHNEYVKEQLLGKIQSFILKETPIKAFLEKEMQGFEKREALLDSIQNESNAESKLLLSLQFWDLIEDDGFIRKRQLFVKYLNKTVVSNISLACNDIFDHLKVNHFQETKIFPWDCALALASSNSPRINLAGWQLLQKYRAYVNPGDIPQDKVDLLLDVIASKIESQNSFEVASSVNDLIVGVQKDFNDDQKTRVLEIHEALKALGIRN